MSAITANRDENSEEQRLKYFLLVAAFCSDFLRQETEKSRRHLAQSRRAATATRCQHAVTVLLISPNVLAESAVGQLFLLKISTPHGYGGIAL